MALANGSCTVPEGPSPRRPTRTPAGPLPFAADQGCTLAMMGAVPGSTYKRNPERQGFRIAYTRVKWHIRKHSSLMASGTREALRSEMS